jgi:replicative DNA helicase
MELFNKEAEFNVVAHAIVDRDSLLVVMDELTPGDFFNPHLRLIVDTIFDLDREGTSIDEITILDALAARKQTGGKIKEQVKALVTEKPSSDVKDLVRIVKTDSTRRTALVGAEELKNVARNESDRDVIVARANQLAMSLVESGGAGPTPVGMTASELYDDVDYWANNPLPRGEVRGIATGIPALDRLLDGMERGESIIFCARPSMGKSALVFEIMLRVGQEGNKCLGFALEMQKKQIVARWAMSRSGVQTSRVRHGVSVQDLGWYVSQQELERYIQAVSQISGLNNIVIDDTPSLTIQQIRARSIRVARDLGGLDLLVVDHGALMDATPVPGENSAQTEGRKARGIRTLAKELDCVAIIVWQLRRFPELRPPRMEDLRGSGELEQDADRVLGLYRPEYNNPDTDRPDQMDVLALKQREGARHLRARLRFEAEYMRFTELTMQLPTGLDDY